MLLEKQTYVMALYVHAETSPPKKTHIYEHILLFFYSRTAYMAKKIILPFMYMELLPKKNDFDHIFTQF